MAFELVRTQLHFFPPTPETLRRKIIQVQRAAEHRGFRFVQLFKTGDPGEPISPSAAEQLLKRQDTLKEALRIISNRREERKRHRASARGLL